MFSQFDEEQRISNIGRHIWFNRRTEASQARYYFEALVLEFGLERVNCLPVNDGFLIHARPECLTLRPLRGCVAPAAPSNRHDGGTFYIYIQRQFVVDLCILLKRISVGIIRNVGLL